MDLDSLNYTLKNQSIMLGVHHQFDLSQFNIKSKDMIYVKIDHNIYDGNYNNMLENIDSPASDMHLVESSGVMRVKQGGKWYEGQVLVKVNGKWEEVTDVLIKESGEWKESI